MQHRTKKGGWTKKDFKEYPRQWHRRIGENHERFFKMKEVVNKFSDKDLNNIADAINSLPEEERSLKRVFMTALIKHPSLLGALRYLF